MKPGASNGSRADRAGAGRSPPSNSTASTPEVGQPLARRHRAPQPRAPRRPAARCGRPATSSGSNVQSVVRLVAVPVAVGGEEHLGSHLAEAVQHAGGAEVGARGGEHRADPVRGQHRHQGLRPVGQPRGDPVPRPDPPLRRALRPAAPSPRASSSQVSARRRPSSRTEITRGPRPAPPGQQILGVAEPGAREEAGIAHVLPQRRLVRRTRPPIPRRRRRTARPRPRTGPGRPRPLRQIRRRHPQPARRSAA